MSNPWIDERLDGVPDRLRSLLRSASEDLTQAALEALEAAEHATARDLRSTGAGERSHATAETLLLADALITYACEQALEGDDPDGHWAALLERLGQERR